LVATAKRPAEYTVTSELRYCSYCGGQITASPEIEAGQRRLRCSSCGGSFAQSISGPSLLVLVAVFAEDRVLLQRRGLPPYRGSWAPPGGFVESGESLEAAAVREVREEVSVELDPRLLMPSAVISLPQLNQVYCGFIARLPGRVVATAVPPEATEVGWFTEEEVRALDNWDPAGRIDIGMQFAFFRSRVFEFIQQTDGFMRMISTDGVRYL
jgi:ADP-ribose pyrophosphatase YjhB (NUDIX family)